MVNLWSKNLSQISRNKITLGWALLNTSFASIPLFHDHQCKVLLGVFLEDMVMIVDDGGVDRAPSESVVLPLPLLRPNWAGKILKDLKIHDQQNCQYLNHPNCQRILQNLADLVLLDVLSEKEVDRVEPVWKVVKTFN